MAEQKKTDARVIEVPDMKPYAAILHTEGIGVFIWSIWFPPKFGCILCFVPRSKGKHYYGNMKDNITRKHTATTGILSAFSRQPKSYF
jgi:hypothetical protein